jgi:hypothetical protein
MPPAVIAAGIGAAASIGGGLIASSGAKKAAKTQAQAAADAQASNERMLERQIGLQEPFRQGGITAQSKIMELLGVGGDKTSAEYGSAAKPFGMDQFNADPGYAFRQSEGMKALERSAAARGGLMSGSALKGIQRFGQDLASQEYQNAFNRYQIERSARLNPLQSLMGAGQSATNVMTGNIGQSSQNEQNNAMNAGAARASGYVGSANALSGALGNIGNMAVQYPLYQAQANYFNNNSPNSGGGYGGMNVNWGSPAPTSNYSVNYPDRTKV